MFVYAFCIFAIGVGDIRSLLCWLEPILSDGKH